MVKIGGPEVKAENIPFLLALCACMFKHDNLWVVSQVDLPGDIVDGANPLRNKEKENLH